MRNLEFKKVEHYDLYHYEDTDDRRVMGDISCSEMSLCSELCGILEVTRRYCKMMLAGSTGCSEADSIAVQTVSDKWFDSQEKRIKNIFKILEKRTGTINILETEEGNSHVEKNHIVAVYFGELETWTPEPLRNGTRKN